MSNLSSMSIGIPCGLLWLVPLMRVIPLLVAITSTGAVFDSSARFKNEKHSISNIWTSSMNMTPGRISALPSSRHSATFWSICSRTSWRISPVSPAKRARKPCREVSMGVYCIFIYSRCWHFGVFCYLIDSRLFDFVKYHAVGGLWVWLCYGSTQRGVW